MVGQGFLFGWADLDLRGKWPLKHCICECCSLAHTHTNTHPFNGHFSGTTQVSRYQKVKPIWILLKQETVSGSGISWAMLQTDNHSSTLPLLFFFRPDALAAAQATASKHCNLSVQMNRCKSFISVVIRCRGNNISSLCCHAADRCWLLPANTTIY